MVNCFNGYSHLYNLLLCIYALYVFMLLVHIQHVHDFPTI